MAVRVFLCLVFSLSGAQCTYTISSKNRLTTQSTTTEGSRLFLSEKLEIGESKYSYDFETGEITCGTAEKVVLNCDIIVCGNDNDKVISNQIDALGWHLTSIEACVLEVWDTYRRCKGLFTPDRGGQLEPTESVRLCTTQPAQSPRS